MTPLLKLGRRIIASLNIPCLLSLQTDYPLRTIHCRRLAVFIQAFHSNFHEFVVQLAARPAWYSRGLRFSSRWGKKKLEFWNFIIVSRKRFIIFYFRKFRISFCFHLRISYGHYLLTSLTYTLVFPTNFIKIPCLQISPKYLSYIFHLLTIENYIRR